MPAALRYRLLLLVIALVGGALIAGCAGAPVQEMSNARQAVRAAEQAGAAERAPQQLADAQQLLKLAEGNINSGEYREAREHALQARIKAIEARQAATRASGQSP